MVMHARKHIRLDGYFDRNQTHSSYENSGSKYSKSPFGDNCNEKSPAVESGASLVAAMDSPENSRRPSPRYLHKASYAQRLKERDHHHEVKSPMSKERSNRSREHSHHHHSSSSSSSQHHGQQSNSTPGSSSSSSRNKNSTSETSASNYARSNHDRSHAEVKMEPEKERKGQVGDWSEHVSSSGKKYYYNCRTEVSQWEKPREWVDWEKVHGINKSVEVPNKSKEKNSGVTPSKVTERHSNSNSRSSANSSSRASHHHQHGGSSHPQRESHSHSHRHDRSHQSSSNRSHSVNDQRNADQASSASSSSSSSSNSSNSSASAGTARNSGRRDERPRTETALANDAPEIKSETRLNDHGIRQESGTNHLTNYHHHNSASSSSKRLNSRKDSAQDMDISPDSSFSADNNNFISAGHESSRSHQYHQQQHHSSSSGHPQQQQMASGSSSLTPSRLPKSSNSGSAYFSSTPSAMTTPIQSLGTALTPTNSASSVTPQLLSPSQVTLANLPRLISQLTGTRGLPNLSEMSQQEALQTVQQALQLTKQLGGLNRSPHGATSSNHDSKNALVLTPALLSAAAALRDGQTGNQNNFYPLGSEGGRIDSSNTRGGTPSSDFHSHSSRQTSPASSAGSPTSVSVTVNSSSNVTTSVAAAMAAAAAAANSSGSLVSAVSLKPSTPSLTPSLANYYREDLVTHVTGWQADHAERQASRYSEEAHNIGSLNSTRVSAELKMARSLVRLAEIQATLQEQRILFLRQQVKELEDRRSQNSFMMDS